jgi:hypothetical protein
MCEFHESVAPERCSQQVSPVFIVAAGTSVVIDKGFCTNAMKTSSGFFDASKSFFRITQTLEATCAVSETQCTSTLDGFARELLLDTACKTDYNNDNPIVLQAYNGLVAYKPAYQASCLRDDEGKYCKSTKAL